MNAENASQMKKCSKDKIQTFPFAQGEKAFTEPNNNTSGCVVECTHKGLLITAICRTIGRSEKPLFICLFDPISDAM